MAVEDGEAGISCDVVMDEHGIFHPLSVVLRERVPMLRVAATRSVVRKPEWIFLSCSKTLANVAHGSHAQAFTTKSVFAIEARMATQAQRLPHPSGELSSCKLSH